MNRRLLALLAALVWITPGFASSDHAATATTAAQPKVAATQAVMRDLWIGHVFWVRNVVDARLAGDAPRATAAEQQVVENAKEIAAAIQPFYGQAAADQLFQLLAGHWGAISEYLDATRAGQQTNQDAAYGRLLANAGRIAEFLGGANPHLPVDTLRSLLTAHGAHHLQQIQQLQARQYPQEAKTWAAMTQHMYVIADALVAGIAAHFPEKFR